MAKQKSSGWLDKFISKVPETFGKGVVASDVVQSKPGPVFLGNPYAKEMAKRQTYLSPQGKSASPAMKKAALDRAQSEKTSDLNKKIATYAQNIGGALELAAPFTGPAMPILGAIGTGLDVGGSAYLASKDISEGNYGSAAMNAGFGALGAAGFVPMVKYNRGLNAAVNTLDDVSDISGLYNSYDNLGREYAGKIRNSKSEIDWAKWNKEIPGNKPLMQEYKAIEQTSKADGTWMKNADGSAFEGTPEQFVQQQSSNFKKAFPEGATTFYRGGKENIDDFVNRKRSDWALFGSDDIDVAKEYAWHRDDVPGADKPFYNSNTPLGDDAGSGLYELGYPSQTKSVQGNASGRSWRLVDWDSKIAEGTRIPDFAKGHNKDLLYDLENGNHFGLDLSKNYDKTKNYLSTDIYANYVKNTNNPETVARISDVIDGGKKSSTVHIIDAERTPMKSLRYNNGMFDLSNPNIYKSLVPALGAGAVASQFVDQKKNGGWLDKFQEGGLTDKYLGVKTNSKGKYVPPTNSGWTTSAAATAYNKAAMQTPTDIDANAMQALEQVTSYPQRKVTEWITGTNQYPSQALGIQNPVGALAVDFALDPLNVLGLPAAVKAVGKLGKGAKNIAKISKAVTKGKKTASKVDDVVKTLAMNQKYGRPVSDMPNITTSPARSMDEALMNSETDFYRSHPDEFGEPYSYYSNSPDPNIDYRFISPDPDIDDPFIIDRIIYRDIAIQSGDVPFTYSQEQLNNIWDSYAARANNYDWGSTTMPMSFIQKKSFLSKLKDKASGAISAADRKLGELVSPPAKLPKDVSLEKLSDEINQELMKGVGVKKSPLELRIALQGNDEIKDLIAKTQFIDPVTNELVNAGTIHLSRQMRPYGSKKFSEIVFPNRQPLTEYEISKNSGLDKWANTLGFAKTGDYPFMDLYSNTVSQIKPSHLMTQGISGEYNKAINEVLKRNNLGNVLSGGTGHSGEGLLRWENLVNKGTAENLGGKYFKLKKNGGWLDKYDDGGPIQPNYNDASVSMSDDFVGDGYSNVGRNYSPAWGGQFKDGGALPQFKPGGKVKPIIVTNPRDRRLKAYNDSLAAYNLTEKGVNFVKNSIINTVSDREKINHSPLVNFPHSYKNIDAVNWEWVKAKNATKGAISDYHILVPGYKKPKQPVIYEKPKPIPTSQAIIDWIEGNNSSEEFVPEVQQPTYINPIGIVEDRQTGYPHEYRKSTGELFIPFRGGQTYVDPNNPRNDPKPKMAMGGSMPGAVGFTYARTINPAPSNGPYAKKTKASAQDGANVETVYSGMLPEITVVGSKDPQTEEFYRNMMDRLTKEEGSNYGIMKNNDIYSDPNPETLNMVFDNPISSGNILGRYQGLMDLGKKYGFPKVHPKDPNSIFAVASKLSDTELESGPRPNYNPFTKTIQASTSKNWLDEMAHHVQFKNNPISTGVKFLTNDVPAYISGKSPYTTSGTMEHEAHSIIEPKLEEEIEASKRNYRQLPYIQKLTEQFYGPIENYQNGGEMRYYQEGLDFKPKTISKDGGWLSKYEEGGVIQDDMGQWAHPGEITEIGSNQITMQGVPYPVLGISDTGDTQMMYPNQDYIYEGSSVTEYPMMKEGGALQLVKLDQLTNFTNYNTKQPGGWLDKYQD